MLGVLSVPSQKTTLRVIISGFEDGEIFVFLVILDYTSQLELYRSHYFYNQKNKTKPTIKKTQKEHL